MKKKAFPVLGGLFLLAIVLQFFRPALNNAPATAELTAPASVRAILRRACYDCHSNQTRLAWFDQPAPAYWLVVRDVRAGRKVLNFSTAGFRDRCNRLTGSKIPGEVRCIIAISRGPRSKGRICRVTLLPNG